MEQAYTERRRDRLYVGLVLGALALALASLWTGGGLSSAVAGDGRPRSIDREAVERRIHDGRLSGHEAEFYRVLDGEAGR